MTSRNLSHVARYLLGAGFTVFGLNGFLHFIPMPPPPPSAGAFLGALVATGYLFPLIKGTEIVAGLLLLSNRWVPLALTLLAPVLVNIVAFHAFLAPAGLALPLVLLAAELYAAWSYREAFAPMLAARVAPAESSNPRSIRQAAHAHG
ncbi:MAG TPA: DoxX family protein [Polyangiaceae bacterium]|nr:DoxX family protein [Polyangiaceae bacterium]